MTRTVAGWWAAWLLFASVGQAQAAESVDAGRLLTATRYDQEYPLIEYSAPATHNRVWRMQQRLDRGELKLQWHPVHGYLPSLLQALDIDVDSQVLVFSSTSLQFSIIDPTNPRAVYFNDDTYVAHVPGSPFMEIASIDARKGLIFHGFDNVRANGQVLREGGRCLTCHDTYSMTGGGVPRVVVMSAPVDDPADDRKWSAASETDDRTPLQKRWGGWYVTGDTGKATHFGNLPLREQKRDERLRALRGRQNISSLEDYFDTSRHLTAHSDVVALLVLEHQTLVQNLLTRLTYKVHTVMGRNAAGATMPQRWTDMTAADRKRVQPMLDALVRALFFADAAPITERIKGSSGFTARFASAGPADRQGRSLRQLDLSTRLFRHPLSFQIYSEQFAALPPFALDYVQAQVAAVLAGGDQGNIGAQLTAADREAIRQILKDTHPDLAARL